MSSSDSSDDDFFDEYFAIETNATPKESIDSYDSDGKDNNDDIDDVITFSAIRTLQAGYRGRQYSVHFLDLTDDEFNYFQQRDVNAHGIALHVKPSHVLIDEQTLSIRRLLVMPDARQSSSDSVSEATNTERIRFSTTDDPLLAEYERNFYFVHETLRAEYEMLLKLTKKPMGTAIRMMRNRIVANRKENVLNVLESTVQLTADDTLFILTPDSSKFNGQRDQIVVDGDENGNQQWQRYIANQANELVMVDYDLLYEDKCAIEIVADYQLAKDKNVDLRTIPHQIDDDNDDDDTDDDGDDETVKSFEDLSSESSDEDIPELRMMSMPEYPVSKAIRQLIRDPASSDSIDLKETIRGQIGEKKLLSSQTMPDDYWDIVTRMIDLEDETCAVATEEFDQVNLVLTKYMDSIVYFQIEPHHAQLVAAIDEKIVDYVQLTAETETERRKAIDGQIFRKSGGRVQITIFDWQKFNKMDTSQTYAMHCLSNRVPFRVKKLCQSFCERDQLIPLLLYNPKYYEREQAQPFNVTTSFQGVLAPNLNAEQQMVVTNILHRRSYPLPFILFGPPGTGKTRTLVAAIEEIVKTTDKFILVCATSNSACDEITERLFEVLEQKNDMFRMYAKSINPEHVSAHLRNISNLQHGKHLNPCLERLYLYRVIITTLCNATCFARAQINKKVYDPKHFSYVFIDECSSASEVLALVPIAGVCSSKGKIEAQIVLAGDPRQLGPVVRNGHARKLGLEISFIDRLMRYELYEMDGKPRQFNDKYIVQLVKNYRSHKSILHVPNQLFYAGKLVAAATADITDTFLGNELLPNKAIPIIFDSIQGTCEVLPGECSCFNEAEIARVIDYVKKLLPNRAYVNAKMCKIKSSDIGIVTPYRKQCHEIRERLKRLGYNDIVIGSAEVFQGKEKPVMLVSTVRSGGVEMGFVKDRRRLNVMITRAKCLMIIVGNTETLRWDKNWSQLINYCIKSKAIIWNGLNL